MKKDIFRSPSKGKLNLSQVVQEISDFIQADKEGKYQLVVGTDSAGSQQPDFVTAIIIYRVGKGARYFWRRTNGNKVYHTLRDRIYQEVNLSLETAQAMLSQLRRSLHLKNFSNCDVQIHIDVGQQGQTKEMIREVVGIVRGNGFNPKIKPESYAASNVADKYV